MNKIVTKSGLGRKCLMSFILFFCSVFISEDAFSQQYWNRDRLVLSYDKINKTITFDFQFYYYLAHFKWHCFLSTCNFQYSEDGIKYTRLMRVDTKRQADNNRKVLRVSQKKRGERIQFFNCFAPVSGTYWIEDGTDVKIVVDAKSEKYQEGLIRTERSRSYMTIKWYMPVTITRIKSIKLNGFWNVSGISSDKIEEVYIFSNIESNSNAFKNNPSELNSEKIE